MKRFSSLVSARNYAILAGSAISLAALSGCSGISFPQAVHAPVPVASQSAAAAVATQAPAADNTAMCNTFNIQSSAFQAPEVGSDNGPAANQARDSKFLGQVSQDANNSTGAVHSALDSFAIAFAQYASVTAEGEATSAEIAALNTAGASVNSACGH